VTDLRAVLIVPAAGRSTRFGLSRPKFLLQHPRGITMLTAGLMGIDLSGFEGIVIVSLAEYFTGHSRVSPRLLIKELQDSLGVPVELRLLDAPTANAIETVEYGIEVLDQDRPIVVKDSDNFVALPAGWWDPGTPAFVAYGDLGRFTTVTAANKSYLMLGSGGSIDDMVEKTVISPFFNVGTVGFALSSHFVMARQSLELAREAYISDVVAQLMSTGTAYHGIAVDGYDDWGTLEDWRRYCRTFTSIFCDLDGVLCFNEHPLDERGGWQSFRPIAENIAALLDNYDASRTRFIFTTSRASTFRMELNAHLAEQGFAEFDLIMDLPHCKRVLINDFAQTAQFPTATAINLPRNAPSLGEYLVVQ
jgi:hypothetical protein